MLGAGRSMLDARKERRLNNFPLCVVEPSFPQVFKRESILRRLDARLKRSGMTDQMSRLFNRHF